MPAAMAAPIPASPRSKPSSSRPSRPGLRSGTGTADRTRPSPRGYRQGAAQQSNRGGRRPTDGLGQGQRRGGERDRHRGPADIGGRGGWQIGQSRLGLGDVGWVGRRQIRKSLGRPDPPRARAGPSGIAQRRSRVRHPRRGGRRAGPPPRAGAQPLGARDNLECRAVHDLLLHLGRGLGLFGEETIGEGCKRPVKRRVSSAHTLRAERLAAGARSPARTTWHDDSPEVSWRTTRRWPAASGRLDPRGGSREEDVRRRRLPARRQHARRRLEGLADRPARPRRRQDALRSRTSESSTSPAGR